MWGGLEKILEHVTSYSSNAGKVWYLIVFVFRLIIVATVGQSVYIDEQSAFRCSTKVIGCDNVCYDKFSKISHIRYWSFQLLAVTAPAVVFHFYSLNVRGHIEKLKAAKKAAADGEYVGTANPTTDDEVNRARAARINKRHLRRQKSVGSFKVKDVYNNKTIETVTWTRSIRAAYLVNVALRIVIEIISLYVAFSLFHFEDYTSTESINPLSVILIKVPQVYLCEGENVEWACGQHLNLGKTPGYVPCWVSRPWEKTIFMCYMNILSAICCVLSCIEFIQLAHRYVTNRHRKKTDRNTARRRISRHLSTRFSEHPSFYPVDKATEATERNSTAITIGDYRNGYNQPVNNNYHQPTHPSLYPAADEASEATERNSTAINIGDDRNSYKQPINNDYHQPSSMTDVPDGEIATLVPYKFVGDHERRRSARNTRRRKFKTVAKRTVGVTLQEEDSDAFSQPSYHSSEYRSSSEEDEDESRKSVSIHSQP